MKLPQRASRNPSQPAGFFARPIPFRGHPWILAVLLCLSLLAPGAPAQASTPAAAGWITTDAPIVDTNVDLNLPVGATSTVTSSFLHAFRPGTGPADLVFTLVTGVTQGTLRNGVTALAQGDTFTQQDIDSDLLSYTAPASVGTDGFAFHVTGGGETSADLVYTIHINKPEPTTYPAGFLAVADSTSQITTSWTDVPGAAAPDGYLVLCSPMGIPGAPIDTASPINNTCTDGSGTMHVAQGVGMAVWEGLNSETDYAFAIFPYAQTDYPPVPGQTPGAFFDYWTGGVTPTANAITFQTYSISGMVADSAFGFGIMGALVDAGGGHTAYSGEDGTYTLTGLTPGDYILSASLPCYTFVPLSLPVTVSEANNHVTGQDFTATAWPCIRGTVTDGAQPMQGVVISDGGSYAAATNEYGTYFIPVPANWSGTLAPSLLNHTFIADSRRYTDVTSDQNDQNYTGIRLARSWDRFTAVWGGITGATGYFLDVASDAGFTQMVPGYQNRYVGNLTQLEVTGLLPDSHYYYRVRPYDPFQTGENSAATEVLTIRAYFFPLVGQ
jgi:hypothetical protein